MRALLLAVALDTGFASAMHVKPKWLRDVLSMLFSGYYLFFANEADEKVRTLFSPSRSWNSPAAVSILSILQATKFLVV